MIASLLSGFSFGASLIVAIGAQNAFVIRQGFRKRHLFVTALLCASIDAMLILFGVFGFGRVIESYPVLVIAAKYFAIVFLFAYGAIALLAAFKKSEQLTFAQGDSLSLRKTILTILALSLLNPHAYLDTVILLGSIASQEHESVRGFFAAGAVCASFLWFFLISFGSSFFASWLSSPRCQKALDTIVACTMWGIGIGLLVSAS